VNDTKIGTIMSNKRKTNRTPYRMAVTSVCGEIDGKTTNISNGGFLLQNRTAKTLEVGQSYTLRLRRGDVNVEAVATVVASREDVFFESGALAFTQLSESARRQLQFITAKPAARQISKVGLGRVALVQRPVGARDSVDRIG
jgi:hypothetical protein